MLSRASSRSRTKEFGVSTTTLNTRHESNRMKYHTCELLTTRGADLTGYSERNCWHRFTHRLMQSILVSGESYRCQLYLRSSASVSSEKQRQMDSTYWYIIHPFSELRTIWQYIMCFIIPMSLFTTPTSLAFFQQEENLSYFWYWTDFVFDIICLMNVLMTFMTGTIDDATKEITLDPRLISRKYVRSYFIIDLISSLPYMFIKFYESDIDIDIFQQIQKVLFFLSLTRLFRMRIFLIFLHAIFEMHAFSLAAFRICRLVVIYVLTIHWTACVHYLAPFLVHGHLLAKQERSWINMSHLLDKPLVEKYKYALFQAVSKVLMLGIGHFYPNTFEDAVCSLLTLIGGAFFNAYLFGVFLHFISSYNSSETKYEETMIQLQEYMRYKKLPMTTQNKLITYHEHIFQKSYFREAAILATLSDQLREDIKMHTCRRLVVDVAIFQGLPTTIINSIISKLQSEVCLPNDVIIKAGNTGDCMFFLASGTAAVMTPTGKEVCHLDDGAHFGEIALIDGEERRVASVIAVDICEIYRLDRKNFLLCIAPHPELYVRIERIAIERMERTLAMEEQHKRRLVERALKQWAKGAEEG